MRLLHVADLHLGLSTHSRPDPATGIPSAVLSTARCWHAACDIAADRGVDLVVLAGDAFHAPNPDATALNLFQAGLNTLRFAKIPVVIVAGNHDRAPHANRQSVLELFHDEETVFVSTEPQSLLVGGTRIATLPSVSRHQLTDMSREEADQAIVDGLCRIIDRFRHEGADILTGHWPVQGAILGNERDIAIVPEPVIPLGELAGPWTYVAMGHIHKAQPLELPNNSDVKHLGAYSGSADRMNFGEEKEQKYAYEVDLETGVLTPHELPARRFITLDVVEGIAEEERGVADYLGDDTNPQDAIVRIRHCPPDLAAEWTKKLYANGAHIVQVEPRVEQKERRRAEKVTETVSPLEALDLWFAAKDIPDDDQPGLRDLAKHLFEDELA